jgi:SHS2 domain-containing protein
MNQFEILDHTSEIRFRSHGESLAEAFENAGRATFAIMADLDDITPDQSLEITVEAESQESLLFDFIDRLIYLRDTEFMLFSEFDLDITATESGYRLTGTAGGCDLEGITAQDVKAVTYSDMEITEDDGTYSTHVVLDV